MRSTPFVVKATNCIRARSCQRQRDRQLAHMSLTSVYLAEEALALPAAERETLARLLLESISPDRRSDEEIRKELTSRLARLQSGEDKGLTFDEVFGEPA